MVFLLATLAHGNPDIFQLYQTSCTIKTFLTMCMYTLTMEDILMADFYEDLHFVQALKLLKQLNILPQDVFITGLMFFVSFF